MMNDEQCWSAVLSRDPSQDGQFYFAVRTTGVYCRPVCPCRTPLRGNVAFYPTPEAAEAAGFRACLRCKPRQKPVAVRVAEVCEYIRRHSDEPLHLAGLAKLAGLSPYHFQRTFKVMTGVSPKQFAEACRMESFKQGLRSGGSVTEAIYDAGFGSASRVYERVPDRLGMTPVEYRDGGRGVSISYASATYASAWSTRIMVGATDRGVCFVQFGGDEEELLRALEAEYPHAKLTPLPQPYLPQFTEWMEALKHHIAGRPSSTEIPLDIRATAFQIKVWRYLQSIPAGATQSYAEVACAIGEPRSARAVARACATNPVALLIPCHRVIRGDGSMGGYRWGVDRKKALLASEAASKGMSRPPTQAPY
ncbi:MAG: bifunctional DNA-binding transcriptional regulator/O6-methylguanine-DNA methyltransferase Ada [Bryobacterales bacterium]|nr:bifunctional DNA-binding transcriptional regulator/O6-methylguanine-DNA methyltransferase Ada [Bryobacterales bacterium]